ncbi:alanine--tRNA ligase [Candidatus Dependentiae bacterium]
MKSKEIRKKFFDFFIERGHEKVASSSLIPAQDPTLLFANAGMNQFKDVFLGKEKRSYTRAVSIQKCIRAGGKHNDLDNVGFTKRHLTFFEMMGNFSFGDYFKEEAIQYAWEFLTKEMELPIEKLHVSVFESDDQAYEIWEKVIGLPKEKIHRLGAKENFWQMGDTGPCGPCTEIHLDQGPGSDPDCTSEICGPECDCDRFLEIWNLVFMQFDRKSDGTDKPLLKTGVDTGMGLERLCAAVQNKSSIFETDLFQGIIYKIELLTGHAYAKQPENIKSAFHAIADHTRASVFAISDGCSPSNDGRGYVLRKIIRRAALFIKKLTEKNILPELVPTIVNQMDDIYPEIKTNEKLIQKILESETEKFSSNLTRGQVILSEYFQENKQSKLITGKQAFKLYDTFGFPLELTVVAAKEKGYSVDVDGFETEMEKQQEQSGKKVKSDAPQVELDESIKTQFTGYHELDTKTVITAIIKDNKVTGQAEPGEECWIITKESPFYIVGGGQIKDSGVIKFKDTKTKLLDVEFFNGAIGVKIKAPVKIKIGDNVTLQVDKEKRYPTMKNHTATHLLQSALIETLGKQVKQAGSLVTPDYLRFDFAYHENLTPKQIKKVEQIVNQKIMDNIPVKTESSTLKEATSKGVIAFFGDKYNPESVRIVQIPNFSAELCGGTHVGHTGEIGVFKITEVAALSAGHRRIFAVTGPKALELFQDSFNTVKILGQEFKVQKDQVLDVVEKQKSQLKKLQTQIKQMKKQNIQVHIQEWQKEAVLIDGMPTLTLILQDYSHDEIKEINKLLMEKKPGFYFIVSQINEKSLFLANISKDFASRVNLKKFSQYIGQEHGLRGGGSATTIQGGGPQISSKLKDDVINWIKSH